MKILNYSALIAAISATGILTGILLATYSSGAARAESKLSQTSKATVSIDSSIIDPVGKLQTISAEVKASSDELTTIAGELDKLNAELDKLEGKTAKNIDRKQFADLEKRFNSTLAKSAAVEKKVGLSLSKSLKDIETVRLTLKNIEKERTTDKKTKRILSDSELKECLKDLSDLNKTVRDLQANLKDNQK